ncbi:MAG: DNA-protecting protein DprA [Clostridiales bacterium]|nr:DNA-protecting protein DprA [Clostridiales bacterium]
MPYTETELYWIWLSNVEGIGLKRFYQLLTIFEDPRAVWDNVGAPELRFLGRKTWDSLRAARSEENVDRLLKALERAGCRALTRVSADYPGRLAEIYDPPATLYVRGSSPLDDERMFGVVGSRRCTRDGQRAAREIARGLARNGVTVVSGLARGTDTCAHEGALEGEGRTIAALGSGVDVIYPPENADLAERILDAGGALISEYPPGTQPLQGHFPARNRIISGLTQGTLIVEGAKGSGAMITVNCALDQGRDVFAVPGSIYSPQSAMPNRLIVDGAVPVLSEWEILSHYRWAEPPAQAPAPDMTAQLDDAERAIVEPLLAQELTFEELRAETGLAPGTLNARLTLLELRGIVLKVPGGMYRAYLGR